MRQRLTVSVAGLHDTRVIRLNGELDVGTVPTFEAAFKETNDALRVVVEMWDLSFIDSCGLRALETAHHDLSDHGRILILSGAPPLALRMMKSLGLDEVLRLDPGM